MSAPMRFPAGGAAAVAVTAPSKPALLAAVEARLIRGEGFTVATLNLDHLVKLRRDPAFRAAYAAADLVTADGNPVVWLSRLAGRPTTLAPGSELVGPLCALAAQRDAPVALIGSTPAALQAAAVRLVADHPGLRIVETIAPPFGFDPVGAEAAAVASRLAAAGARLCFVALGAPKQEVFAAFARSAAAGCGFVCVGAGVDFVAGTQRRAPAWVRAVAMEWFWRMASEPRRLAGRYLDCALALPRLTAAALRLRFTPQ